jgi:HK97 family phage prohead protease
MTILEVVRSLPLESEEVDVVGRRLDGMAFAWDRLYRVTDDGHTFYEEGFRRGCATQTLRARRNTFELRDEHLDERIGLVGFSEADDGLVFAATLDGTPQGDQALDHLRAHVKTGVSIRYGIVRNQPRSGPPYWRSQIELRELSLTGRPQYADALVSAIRSQPEPVRTWKRPADLDAILAWTPPEL